MCEFWNTVRETYHFWVPTPCEINVVVGEISLGTLGHLSLHFLEQICEPFKSVGVRANPVEVHFLQFHVVRGVHASVPGGSSKSWGKLGNERWKASSNISASRKESFTRCPWGQRRTVWRQSQRQRACQLCSLTHLQWLFRMVHLQPP